MAFRQIILWLHQKERYHQFIILNVNQPMWDKDKVWNLLISLVKIGQKETLQCRIVHSCVLTDTDTVHYTLFGVELFTNW